MTIEEAVKTLKKYPADLDAVPDAAVSERNFRIALKMAIEALEKTQKKKPEEFYDGYSDGYPVIEYKCPVCGWELDDTDDHCPYCDQAIDWGKDDFYEPEEEND